jgi:hypothetical protein
MLLSMGLKGPFSEADWLATPEPVRQYVECRGQAGPDFRCNPAFGMGDILAELIEDISIRIAPIGLRLNNKPSIRADYLAKHIICIVRCQKGH